MHQLTSWHTEDRADAKLSQPGEQVVADFDRHCALNRVTKKVSMGRYATGSQ